MRGIRWMFGAAGLTGALLAAIIPGRGEAQHAEHDFTIYMMPSTGPSGESPKLTSGWHTSAKSGLDWARYTEESEWVAPDVWFRGYGFLSGHNEISFPLTGRPLRQQGGEEECDITGVWIMEGSVLRAIPQYIHTELQPGETPFGIAVKDTPLPNSRNFATMTGDWDCYAFSAPHSHDTHYPDENWDPTPNVLEALNTDLYPNDSNYPCNWGGDCIYQPNYGLGSTTRLFKWGEGA